MAKLGNRAGQELELLSLENWPLKEDRFHNRLKAKGKGVEGVPRVIKLGKESEVMP